MLRPNQAFMKSECRDNTLFPSPGTSVQHLTKQQPLRPYSHFGPVSSMLCPMMPFPPEFGIPHVTLPEYKPPKTV